MATPVRTCVVCRIKADKDRLHRFVWRPNGPIHDEQQRFDGRGAYCCKAAKCKDRFLAQEQKWRKTFRK